MGSKLHISHLFFVLTCFFFISCGDSNSSSNGSQPSQNASADHAAKGASIFDKNCKICHGSDGRLGLNGAKDLSISTLTRGERIQVITNGRNLMAPFGKLLTAVEIDSVAGFTLQLQKSNPK